MNDFCIFQLTCFLVRHLLCSRPLEGIIGRTFSWHLYFIYLGILCHFMLFEYLTQNALYLQDEPSNLLLYLWNDLWPRFPPIFGMRYFLFEVTIFKRLLQSTLAKLSLVLLAAVLLLISKGLRFFRRPHCGSLHDRYETSPTHFFWWTEFLLSCRQYIIRLHGVICLSHAACF